MPPGNATRYEVDAADRIRGVDERWERAARESGASELRPETLVGRSVFEFIAGGEVRHLYGLLFASARRRREPIAVPFRCDSPDRRRFMELRIAPGPDDGLAIETRLIAEERRAPVAWLAAPADGSAAMVAMCSWCKRVRTAPEAWEEIEDAVRALDLFDGQALPGITHGICPVCDARLAATLGR